MPRKLSLAQRAANRANAQKSTGPRTPEGKARSRANSITHNLTGRIVFLTPQDRESYDEMVSGILDRLDPQDPLELQTCRNIADAHWRLSRVRSVEDVMLTLEPRSTSRNAPPASSAHPDAINPDSIAVPSDEPPPPPDPVTALRTSAQAMCDNSPAFANVGLYEQRLHRTIKSSMEQLRLLRAERADLLRREMPSAVDHLKERKMRNLPFYPATDGFVFSNDEIEFAEYLERRQNQVRIARECDFNPVKYAAKYPSQPASVPKQSLPDDVKDAPLAA